jgi:cell division protein FtsB
MSKKYNLSPSEKLNYVEKGNSKKIKSKRFRQILLTLIILIGLFLIVGPYLRDYHEKKELEKKIAQVENEINKYEKDNEELKEFLSYLSSDQAVEERARLDLGLKKEGEKVVVIKKDTLVNNQVKSLSDEVITEPSNPRKWLNYFFNINMETDE